jgi:hypothetical protein
MHVKKLKLPQCKKNLWKIQNLLLVLVDKNNLLNYVHKTKPFPLEKQSGNGKPG